VSESWLDPKNSIAGASTPSWMAPPPPTAGDRVSWGLRRRVSDVPRITVPPRISSMAPPISGMPRSLVPPAPPGPAAIFDIEEVIAPYVAELRTAMEALTASVEAARADALLASERGLVDLALAIAERVVGRELATDPALVSRWAREGIAALHDEDDITIVASTDVAARLEASLPDVRLEVDAAAEPGSCRVRARWGSVDASMKARLAATMDALEPPEAAPRVESAAGEPT